MLQYLSAAAQGDYAFHIEGIESNDTLYGGSEQWLSAVARAADSVLAQVRFSFKFLKQRRLLQLMTAMNEMRSAQHHTELATIACQLGRVTASLADLHVSA